MIKKKLCPILNKPCMRSECALWVSDAIRVVNTKTHKSGVKDNSNCAFEKMGEEAAMNIWNETERIINEH